eukprot:4885874-Amphidinium_carterae.1
MRFFSTSACGTIFKPSPVLTAEPTLKYPHTTITQVTESIESQGGGTTPILSFHAGRACCMPNSNRGSIVDPWVQARRSKILGAGAWTRTALTL